MKDRQCSIWHIISGIIMILLGIFIWLNPLPTLLTLSLYLGLALFLIGCGYVSFSFVQYSGWYFVVGLLDIFIGLILMTNLGLTVQTLPIIFAFWFLATGTMQISGSIDIKKLGLPWKWSMFSGISGILLAFLILIYQPLGDALIVFLIGLNIVLYGLFSMVEYFFFRQFCQIKIDNSKK